MDFKTTNDNWLADLLKTNNSEDFYNYFLAECITRQPQGKGCGHATGSGYFDESGESSKCASAFCESLGGYNYNEYLHFWGNGCRCGIHFIKLNL